MNALAISSTTIKTMTLKEITDLLDVRHNDAMNTVERMAENEEFGLVTKISYPIISGKGREQLIETYQLTKRQSIAIAARLNTALLMRIVDRWQELEEQQHTLAQDAALALEALHSSIDSAVIAIHRLNSVVEQTTLLSPNAQNLFEDDVIKYLTRKGMVTSRYIQQARTKIKPWVTIKPKSAIGATMRATIDNLAKKGVIEKDGYNIRLLKNEQALEHQNPTT
jgi:phage regulator Rha-like protein